MNRALLVISALLTAMVLPGVSIARERLPFEGVWAATDRECEDEEGPNTRTLIATKGTKVGPLFDQYENHCRIMRIQPGSRGYRLSLVCYEFWEYFEKRKDPRNVTVNLVVQTPQRILMDGKKYVRCIR
jgi:hypothetical protein